MNIYTRKQRWKLALLLAALIIGVASLWYTNSLVEKLSEQEKKNVKLWASAVRQLSEINEEQGDVSVALEVLRSNNTIPMILTDANGNINSFRNLDSIKSEDPQWLLTQVTEMKTEQEPIEIIFGKDKERNFVYFRDSLLIKQLRYYPYFQLAVISLFLLVSYLAFSTSRKAEQNQVWVGMAKETAHQLGTPLSSLMAWVEYLKMHGREGEHLEEIEKDISRLNTITERFSKIGSAPSLKKEDLVEVIQNSINYIQSRSSSRVKFTLINTANHNIMAPMNVPLFEWVLENLFKNAVDAMTGEGELNISLTDQQQFVYIDICDTGKGIPKSKFKTVFKPGYTSKSRGWGLGLSLSKRIVEEYHNGHIFVKNSELNKGTTFRIVLPK
ncbi:MAG: HAMP domain-containing histidine kinase [Bacteroidetes bacterium]|nr:HAMP domain-containing histidine kinase [Bacteroidota bacterium]